MFRMSNTIEGFGKRICDLVGSVAPTKDDCFILYALTDKVILDINVLCTLIDGCIVGKIFSAIIINFDLHRMFGIGRIEDGTNSCQPYCLLGREAACYIFCLARGSSNDGLFFRLPAYSSPCNKKHISTCRFSCLGASGVVRVGIA